MCCGKRSYSCRSEARKHLENLKRSEEKKSRKKRGSIRPLVVYLCKKGKWHVGHNPFRKLKKLSKKISAVTAGGSVSSVGQGAGGDVSHKLCHLDDFFEHIDQYSDEEDEYNVGDVHQCDDFEDEYVENLDQRDDVDDEMEDDLEDEYADHEEFTGYDGGWY
mmetsp:Transcript_33604/g.65411  ORF Transcript_33604/g.65411 Transcript_33604/m.65411 type:complete len:162 (+) Transcript_33604:83-568(+)